MRCALGIDIGGGTTRLGLVRDDGLRLAQAALPTPPNGEPRELVRLLSMVGHALREHVAPARGCELAPLAGVALPGIYDREAGIVRRSVNLPLLEGFPFKSALQEQLRSPIVVDTDVIAAGWAQWRALEASNAIAIPRFVYLSLGTGVGGCVILDGQIVRHTRGGAGHLGHLIVDSGARAPLCRCGARGCLEEVVCGGLRHMHEAGQAGRWNFDEGPDLLPAADDDAVFFAQPLARGLLQIAHLYAPSVLALGGGVIEHHPELLRVTLEEFERVRSTLVPPDLRIMRAPLRSDQAGVTGAAMLALASRAERVH